MAPTGSCNTKIMGSRIKYGLELSVDLAIYNHNLIKNCQLYTLDKSVSKELYKFHFALCTKNLNHKATMKNYLKQKI